MSDDIEDDEVEGQDDPSELIGRASDGPASKEDDAAPEASGKGKAPADSKDTGDETPVVKEETTTDQPEWVSIRDIARQRGQFDPATWSDDEAAANEIVDGYRRYREIEPDFELYRRMQPQFQAWLAGQQSPNQPPAPAPQEAPKWYVPPEFNQAWLNDLELDDNGNIRAKKGTQVSPDRINKVANYIQWTKEAQRRFFENPQAAISEIVESQIEERSSRIASEQVAELRAHHEAQSFVNQHANWLFRTNEKGQRVKDPISGRDVLTPEGQLFGQYFEQAERRGLKSMADMTDYALAMLERHLLRSHYDGQNPAKEPVKGKTAVKEALSKASRSPKRAASQANPREPGKSGQNPKASLAQQLMADLQEAGIGADDID